VGLSDDTCRRCAELEQLLLAERARSRQLAERLLAQTHIAKKNQDVAEQALVEFLHPTPGAALRVG
jgi:hypothetical protein